MKIRPIILYSGAFLSLFVIFCLASFLNQSRRQSLLLLSQTNDLGEEKSELEKQFALVNGELTSLKGEDQYLINQKLASELENIQTTYKKAVSSYESLLDLRNVSKKNNKLEEMLALSLRYLSERNYSSASATLANLDKKISEERNLAATSFKIPDNVSVNNSPPSSGYRRQKVEVSGESYLVDIVSADLNSAKVIVDTASEADCTDNCPVLSLGDYVSRNNAFAGINGSYFCPSTYPDCSNKKNSFDTLLMNKSKRYFNSDNNVYSSVPAVIFSGSSARFVQKSQEWGRDTGVDAVMANHPLLVFNGGIAFSGGADPKQGSKGARSFIGTTGSTVYIGVVHNATVAESALVLNALGIANALNLDDGGSTALWHSGYKAGPGRNIPNAILLVRK